MRLARIVVLVLAAVAVGAVAGLLVLERGDGEQSERFGLGRTLQIRTSLEPRVHLFGDPVTAHVDLLFDQSRVEPNSIVVDAVFRPYERIGRERRENSDVGDTVRMRISYALQCLARACAPGAPRREIRFPPVRVLYLLADVRSRANDIAEWPPVDVASRLGPFDIQEASWRADTEPPPVTYAVSPGWLAAGLGGASLALLLAAALLAWRLLERRRDADAEAVPLQARPPLERALEHVRLAAANGDVPDRRRALERLARELDRVQADGLALRARRLAWSAGRPEREHVERLVDDVREQVETTG
jgi:hypothetical protein